MRTIRSLLVIMGIILAGTFYAAESVAVNGATVAIDIKPGGTPNSINLRSAGKIPVAILSSADFNAPSRVDRTSLTFGRTGDEHSLVSCDARATDVNKDQLPDLVCTFDTQRTGFTTADTMGILKGRTKDGQPIVGQDAVRIVPPVGAGDKTPPTVIATAPANGAVGVAVTSTVTATFSEPMNCATLTAATFLVRAGSSAIPGTVTCNSSTATFTPAAVLSYSTLYTAMVTTGAKDLAGNAMASNYVWSFTTVPPPTYSISGTVSISGGGSLAGATIDLSGAANANTITAASGSYSFAGLLPGTYTITPSMTGYLFTSATVTITSADVTRDFTATSAVPSYSVSGTVNYTGGKPGRIYVSLRYSGGGGEPGRGTSIETPGTFLIRGLQPGNYDIYAWLDTMGNGIQNVANPSGMSGTFMVSGTDVSGITITMTDPVLPPPSVPGGLGATPMDGAAVVYWNTIGNPNGQGDGATAYRVSWNIDGEGTFLNSVIVQNTNIGVYFHDGLPNGQDFYYRVSSFIEGAESAPSPAVGPILIGAPSGGVSVSGTVTFTGDAAGHKMWVALVDEKSGRPAFTSAVRIANPISPQDFTIPGVQPGNYILFPFVDMDDNGWFNTGDKMPDMNTFGTFPLTVTGTNVTGLAVQLSAVNSTAVVATIHDLRAYFDGYALSFDVEDQIKRAVMVTIMSGLNIPLPVDLDRNWGHHYTEVLLGTLTPAVGDAYTFRVTYADGTSETLMASVTGVIGPASMATPISPVGPGASTVPTLFWEPPLSPPPGGFTYIVGVAEASGPWIWYYPNNGMPSTQTSVVYNVDGSASLPVLAPGTTYDWWVQVTDSNTNKGRRQTTFTTGMGYTISGTVTNASTDQTHKILVGACQDPSFTICNYGTMLDPGAGGPYAIASLPTGTYYVGTCVDSIIDNKCVLGNAEPQAGYISNPVVITNTSVMGINMTIPGGIVSYSISGTVTNASGDQTHNILIGACQDPAFTVCKYVMTMFPNGSGIYPYTITGVPAGTYYVGTCVDSIIDNKCVPGNGEPQAAYINNPVVITNTSATGINMTIPGMPIQGTDYWMMEYGVCPDVWPAKLLSDYTEDDWAKVRSGTLYNLNWRTKVTLSPVEATGVGTATFTDSWNHRQKVDQSGSGPGGVTPGTGATMGTVSYTLAANNEMSMAINGDVFHMAMSRDGNFFTGVHREANSACQDMLMAVKAATAPVTVSDLYAMVNNYSLLFYTQQTGMPEPNPAADTLGTYGQIIWSDQTASAARFGLSNYLQTYPVTQADAGGHAAVQVVTGGAQGPQTTDPDGTLTSAATGRGDWHAVSPDGQLRITALGTNDYTVSSSGSTTLYRHTLGSQLSLKQDPGVTYTAADIVGTYFLSARRDDVTLATAGTISVTPPPSCASNASDEPGTAACGTGVHPRWRMSWGYITFNPDGIASADLTEFNDQKEETTLTTAGTYTVRKQCFGSSGATRLPLNDPVCAGGRILDVVVVTINATNVAKFFIGNGGDVLALYDPTGFAPVAGLAGQSRWIGSAVRLKTASASYSISGTVTNNSADQSHNILIGVCQDPAFTVCKYGMTMFPNGSGIYPYTITGVPAGTYYVGTCVDSNNDNMCVLGNGEPQTSYSGNPVVITNAGATGINMTIPGGMMSYSISGTVTGPWIEGIAMTLGGDGSGVATTDANGGYSFANLPPGTYTITPALAGYAYAPASPAVVITTVNRMQNFTATSTIASYSISGMVSYGGAKIGRVYINALSLSCGGCTASSGTSIASSGTYTIRGLVPGDYVLTAWMDNMGTGARNAGNPTGSSITVPVASNNVSGASIILADPVSVPTPTTPANLQAYPGSESAMILWERMTDTSGIESATAYNIHWGTDVNATNGGVITVGAREDTMYFQSVASGKLYYRISSLVGAAESAASAVVGPITIGALPGANTVSGSVTFPGTATGPMYVLIIGENPGSVYLTRIANPSSPQYYSITGVPNGNYFAIFAIDMNDNGVVTNLGDISNTSGLGPGLNVNVNGDVTVDQTLTGVNALAWVMTTHALSGAVHSYSLAMEVYKGMKLPAAVTLVSGPNVVVPKDAGINPWGFTIFTYDYSMPRPTVGDAYQFKVTYSDGSSETLTGTVNAVLDTFAQNLIPLTDGTGGSSPSVPLFTWADPASAPAYHEYEFNLYGSDANWWHGVMPGSQHSVLYNVDGNASKANLTTGITYNWSVMLRDASHNYATQWSTYTP